MSQPSSASAASAASPASSSAPPPPPPPYLYCATSRESSAVSFSVSGYLTCAQPLTPQSSSSSSSSSSYPKAPASSSDDSLAAPRIFKNLVVARGCTIDIYAGTHHNFSHFFNYSCQYLCIFDISFSTRILCLMIYIYVCIYIVSHFIILCDLFSIFSYAGQRVSPPAPVDPVFAHMRLHHCNRDMSCILRV